MPFWRLKGDGFWDLKNTEFCSTTGSKQPPVKELVEHNVAGGFDEEHFALLNKNKNLIGSLAQQILEAHFPESIQEESADEIQQIRKVRDPLFRQQVLRAYTMNVLSADSICGTITPPLNSKPRILSGSSLGAE